MLAINTKNGTKVTLRETHANNRGIITVFFYIAGGASAESFSLEDYKSTKDYLSKEYPKLLIIDDSIETEELLQNIEKCLTIKAVDKRFNYRFTGLIREKNPSGFDSVICGEIERTCKHSGSKKIYIPIDSLLSNKEHYGVYIY